MTRTSGPRLTRKQIQRVYGGRFADDNAVTLLWKDREYFEQIFAAVRDARSSICLAFYIFRNDETGSRLSAILKEKASAGVSVCLLYDHFGSFFTPRGFWKDLAASGVSIAASRPFMWSTPFHYVHRDHRKLIIIDGTIAFTGGLNIANEYFGYHRFRRRRGWRDTGVMLEGPVVRALFEQFSQSWRIWKGGHLSFHGDDQPRPNGVPVLPIFASSARGRRRMRKLLYYSVNSATESICITTAYFTPSRRLLQILERAVDRGVRVRLLLPGKSDVTAAHFAGRAFFSRLLRAGVEIYTYHGEILHAKTAVFDSQWSIIGSANLDFQSLRRNDEGNVGIIDRGFGEQMIDTFHEDLKASEQILLAEWRGRPLHEKLREHFFALFRRKL